MKDETQVAGEDVTDSAVEAVELPENRIVAESLESHTAAAAAVVVENVDSAVAMAVVKDGRGVVVGVDAAVSPGKHIVAVFAGDRGIAAAEVIEEMKESVLAGLAAVVTGKSVHMREHKTEL